MIQGPAGEGLHAQIFATGDKVFFNLQAAQVAVLDFDHFYRFKFKPALNHLSHGYVSTGNAHCLMYTTKQYIRPQNYVCGYVASVFRVKYFKGGPSG